MSDFGEQIQLLQDKVDGTRYQFLLAETQTCALSLDFGRLEYEQGNTPRAQGELLSVLKGVATIEKFLPDLKDDQQRDTINKSLAELKTSVESLQQLLQGKAA